jgi:hypothetical protein
VEAAHGRLLLENLETEAAAEAVPPTRG